MTRKLKYGQGCIAKRTRKGKKGYIYKWYEAKWYDEYGNHKTKTAKTQREAHNILSQVNKRNMKNTIRKQIKTFGTYLIEWYIAFGSKNAGESRNKLNLTQINRIPKNIMEKSIEQVTAQELQEHLDCVETEYGGNPKWWTKLLLAGFLKHAFFECNIKHDIGILLNADEPPPLREKNILPRELEEKFLSFFSPSKNSVSKVDYRPYVRGLIYTGCRISEFMTIGRYSDTQVDKTKGILKCRETKSIRSGDRKRGVFYRIREFPWLPVIADLEFPMDLLTNDRLQYNFRVACKKLGLKLTPHDMRHTCQSRFNELGIARSVSMEVLGWKTEKMAKYYTHNTKELLEKEFAKMRNSTTISTTVREQK